MLVCTEVLTTNTLVVMRSPFEADTFNMLADH